MVLTLFRDSCPESPLFVRFSLSGAPDTNQRSVCGGESRGIGRFDERETLSPCDPITEGE